MDTHCKSLDPLYKWMVHAKDGKSHPTDELMKMLYQLKSVINQ